MSCFIIPAAEAVVTTIVSKSAKNSEEKDLQAVSYVESSALTKIPFSRKLSWLSNMLYGGSALLAFEHVWHGELSPVFPFLTAAGSSAGMSAMLHEMMTVGVGMSLAVTAVWGAMLAVVALMEKKTFSAPMMHS